MDPGISFYCSNRKGYLPQPPREWSRVQNSCSVITPTDDTGLFQVPYSKKVLPYSEIGPTLAMISKGNVLQYKKNSSNLTQWQKYSKIAKGQWVNRTKTWATQSDRGYTNPNNMNLIRVGGVNVTLNGTATTLPVTCPKPGTIVYPVLPANSGGGGGEPNPVLPPPPIAPVDGGNVIPITPVPVPEPVVIQDFGNLVCGTYENVCTGERTPIILLDNCHPTTDSDVPGPIEELCWNDGNPTWYPRQRYIMTNSDNKWPINAVLGSADKFTAPALSASVFCNVITLSWNLDLFYSIYNIFQDEYTLPIGVVSGTTNTFTINIDEIGTYSFYIKGVNGNVRSEASNTVSVSISQTPAPTNLTYTLACNVAALTWTDTSPCNLTYQVYEDGVLIDTTTQQTLSINLDAVGTYDFYVIALLGSIESVPSNTVSVSISQTLAPTNLTYTTACNKATLNWVAPGSCNYTYEVYKDSVLIGTTNNITTLGNITLVKNVTYHFYVIAVLGSIPSVPSSSVSITFVEYAQTGGVEYNYNPLSGDTTSTGYTYILFDTVGTSFTFNSGCTITNFYYMIVGPGGIAQGGYKDNYYSIGGDGGGAGGIWNDVTTLPQGNYTITIPAVNNTSSTIIEDSTIPANFNITATTGSFIIRGAVTQTVNSTTTTLSPSSTTSTQPGVGGKPSEVTNASGSYVATPGTIGGSVYLGSSSSGNYIYFVGDTRLSNKLFGGGGGGGGTGGADIYPATTGYNGGGGGGGGGVGLAGGTGINGLTGNSNGGAGGNAFTSLTPVTPGYGGGGGGGGSVYGGGSYSVEGAGGTGGPAMLMIYFIKQF
jgi:hypothetical protein